ncbi:MAG: glutamine-hydrolyzing carbamoyl-phosphate synthase small subunit [Gammaproteobacteria bacterium]
MQTPSTAAILALEDGLIFEGISIGYQGATCGEVVFNTAMTGYQEILSDPSYAEQIITLTYPHIGNTGTNEEDNESGQVFAKGLVIRDLSSVVSNWRSTASLYHYLETQKIVGIAEIDTRELTHHLRKHGAKRGAIVTGATLGAIDRDAAVAMAKGARDLKGLDLAQEVTCKAPYRFEEQTWEMKNAGASHDAPIFKVVVLDYGVKRNILRILVDLGCEVHVLPAKSTLNDVMAYAPHGVVLSNGPGDPAPCDYAIQLIQDLLKTPIPIYGICLGHQLLGLAVGAKTYKMPFGHHGANHPVMDLDTQKVWTTSQNHGFAIQEEGMPAEVVVTHRSLFDQSIQGIRLKNRPVYAFQGHPEASPGPHDAMTLFHPFIDAMKSYYAETH